MGYITGNQDRGRFISYAGGDLLFEEDAKMAGWTRDIGVGKDIGYSRLRSIMAFNMTIPGIPVIYYGDEIGMPGGNDPDNRRMMRFEGLSENEMATREITSYLTGLRKASMALTYGDFMPLLVEDHAYGYARSYFDEKAIILFNKALEPKELRIDIPDWISISELHNHFGHEYTYSENIINVTLPAVSFEVFTTSEIEHPVTE